MGSPSRALTEATNATEPISKLPIVRFDHVGSKIRQIAIDVSPQAFNSRRAGVVSTGGYSLIDSHVTFHSVGEMLGYLLPRGMSIALLAPFPNQWFDTRGRTGAFRAFSLVEMIPLYLILAGFVWRIPRFRQCVRAQMVMVLLFISITIIPLSLIVANLGTLFRLRLQILLPLIIVACLVDVPGLYRDGAGRMWRWLCRSRRLTR